MAEADLHSHTPRSTEMCPNLVRPFDLTRLLASAMAVLGMQGLTVTTWPCTVQCCDSPHPPSCSELRPSFECDLEHEGPVLIESTFPLGTPSPWPWEISRAVGISVGQRMGTI